MATSPLTQITGSTTVAAALVVAGCTAPPSGASNEAQASAHQDATFVEWARTNAVPILTTKPGSDDEDLEPW